MKPTILFLMLSLLLLAGCNTPVQPPVDVASTATAVPENTPTTPAPSPQPTEDQDMAVVPTVVPTAARTATTAPSGGTWIAYIGMDGNLWLTNPQSGEQRQLSSEATSLMPPGNQLAVTFSNPRWSSDGQLLAFTREVRTPQPDRMTYETSLWVYALGDGQARAVLQGDDVSFRSYDWQPGKHVLAFGQNADLNYFTTRGVTDAQLAHGLRGLYVDSGEIVDLVLPGRGFHLGRPQWTPDGNALCFEEVRYMEGLGTFACFDFRSSEYLAWDIAIGTVSFAPNSQQMAYDYLTYAPSGEERIYLNNLKGSEEIAFAPQYGTGFTYQPVYAPQGDQIAYIGEFFENNVTSTKVLVQGLQDNQPREIGLFESPAWLSWSPDGQQLLLTIGPYESSQIILVNVVSGAIQPLAMGITPVWQP